MESTHAHRIRFGSVGSRRIGRKPGVELRGQSTLLLSGKSPSLREELYSIARSEISQLQLAEVGDICRLTCLLSRDYAVVM
jgi:hypothetical protein